MSRLFKVTVNGREYDVAVLEITAEQTAVAELPPASAGSSGMPQAAPAAVPRQAPVAGSGDAVAGMGGVVMEVLVKTGQTVAAGERLVIVEAMKMKTPIMATRAGQVTRVLVTVGDVVEAGQALVTIG
jgi:glutaconyl-CoA/methylmalonyl-CoA decarboxylase subunit gamma